MPFIKYIDKRFSPKSLEIIDQANEIIDDYANQGYDLTLRQLYYQFVSRDLIPNKQSEYKRLGSIINDARLAGVIDWNTIVDRTRNLRKLSHWNHPKEIIESCAAQFRIDKWENQEVRPEVWIEKDALVGVIADVCEKYDVPYFSCRGYTSQSEMWSAGQRHLSYAEDGQLPVIIHLGDHDPSGVDMSRDIRDRLNTFGTKTVVKRIALNYEQIEHYRPPPNPAKLTDSRCPAYIDQYGADSWELDALEPKVISELIEENILALRKKSKWTALVKKENQFKEDLKRLEDMI